MDPELENQDENTQPPPSEVPDTPPPDGAPEMAVPGDDGSADLSLEAGDAGGMDSGGDVPELPEPMDAIGHTSSGKPIHAAAADHPAYAGFSPRDHQDAVHAHRLEAAKAVIKQHDHREHAKHSSASGDHGAAAQHAHAAEVEGHKARQHDQFMRDHAAKFQGIDGDPNAGADQNSNDKPSVGKRMTSSTQHQGPMGKSLLADWIKKSAPQKRIQKAKDRSLKTWFEKHQKSAASSDSDWDGDELPGGEPGLFPGDDVRKPQDGGKLTGVGKMTGSSDSGASTIGDVNTGKNQVLSDDDIEIDPDRPSFPHDSDEIEIGSTRFASERPSGRDSTGGEIGLTDIAEKEPRRSDSEASEIGDINPGRREVLSRKSLFEDSVYRESLFTRLQKSIDEDLVVGVGVRATPAKKTEPIRKSREWSIGKVHYSAATDDYIADQLERSESDFWAPFQAPALTYDKPIQKSETCFMCKAQKPVVLSVCPHCGVGKALVKSSTPVQVRGVSTLRILRREDDLSLPNGIKVPRP